MFDWLFERHPAVFLLLAVAAVLFAALWWRNRKRGYALALGGVLALAGVYYLLSVFVVTDRRQLETAVKDLAGGVKERNLDRTFAKVSNDFRRGGWDKQTLRQHADAALRNFDIQDVEVWDIQVTDLSRENRTAHVQFQVKVRGNWSGGQEFYLCKSEFVLDPDNQWRLRNFDLFNPFVDTNTPLTLPF